MALNPSNSSYLEQLALNGLKAVLAGGLPVPFLYPAATARVEAAGDAPWNAKILLRLPESVRRTRQQPAEQAPTVVDCPKKCLDSRDNWRCFCAAGVGMLSARATCNRRTMFLLLSVFSAFHSCVCLAKLSCITSARCIHDRTVVFVHHHHHHHHHFFALYKYSHAHTSSKYTA